MYFTKNNRIFKRKFHRELLPSALGYYQKQFPGLRKTNGYALVNCIFHNDRNPSLSVDLEDGHFNCFSCGAKGGSVLDFHIRRFEMEFLDAANELGALR